MNDRFITASLILLTALIGINCSNEKNMNLEVFETSAAGNQLTQKPHLILVKMWLKYG